MTTWAGPVRVRHGEYFMVFKFPREVTNLMGGTSLIIMVGVATDTMAQIEALLKMHHQDGFIKKGKIRSRNI